MPEKKEDRGKVGEFYVPYAREKRRKREGRRALRALCPRKKREEGR
ncbi:hypothetical protein [Mesobacillus foraminis]|nr:hypothetical protein [Mesobacillus foraminis]